MLVNMNDVLLPAKEKGYGVGFFNAVNVEMARAVIETAEELNAPVMVGTAEVLLPAMEMERVAEYLIPMAQKAKVPV
jgi:fructose-bisphosphate aldolase class II